MLTACSILGAFTAGLSTFSNLTYPLVPTLTNSKQIAQLNDLLRQTFLGGRVMLTVGIQALEENQRNAILTAVKDFNAFTPDNDPYEEHDFGCVTTDGIRAFFKIDYYDKELAFASPEPSDPTQTIRVLTIMLASEY